MVSSDRTQKFEVQQLTPDADWDNFSVVGFVEEQRLLSVVTNIAQSGVQSTEHFVELCRGIAAALLPNPSEGVAELRRYIDATGWLSEYEAGLDILSDHASTAWCEIVHSLEGSEQLRLIEDLPWLFKHLNSSEILPLLDQHDKNDSTEVLLGLLEARPHGAEEIVSRLLKDGLSYEAAKQFATNILLGSSLGEADYFTTIANLWHTTIADHLEKLFLDEDILQLLTAVVQLDPTQKDNTFLQKILIESLLTWSDVDSRIKRPYWTVPLY